MRLLRPSEVAGLLAVDSRTIQRLIASGRLPALRVGSRWRIRPDDLTAYLAAATEARSADGPGATPSQSAERRTERPAHVEAG
jgi:excisionase family DNA binding protein